MDKSNKLLTKRFIQINDVDNVESITTYLKFFLVNQKGIDVSKRKWVKMTAGGKITGVYVKLSEEEVKHILRKQLSITITDIS